MTEDPSFSVVVPSLSVACSDVVFFFRGFFLWWVPTLPFLLALFWFPVPWSFLFLLSGSLSTAAYVDFLFLDRRRVTECNCFRYPFPFYWFFLPPLAHLLRLDPALFRNFSLHMKAVLFLFCLL